MNKSRAIYYLCHVLTQVTRQSCFYKIKPSLYDSCSALESWSYEEWKIFCSYFLENETKTAYFLQKFYSSSLENCRTKIAEASYSSIQQCLESNGSLIVLKDPSYPSLLKQIPQLPFAFYLKGNIKQITRPALAIIGSRRSNFHALQQSLEIARSLAEQNFTVVSGGAFGCDRLAHQGALEAKNTEASTVAVLASGLSNFYPKGNHYLFEKILSQGGAIISERLWHQTARPYDFPIRNRIISGLCYITLVMDASLKSGSLVTAQRALEQGRELMVLKAFKEGLVSSGIELLREEGAPEFSSSTEILASLPQDISHSSRSFL